MWQWFSWLLPLGDLIERPAAPPMSMIRRIETIARAPWLRRVWVIQEVASGKCVRLRVAEEEGSWDILRALTIFAYELLTTLTSIGAWIPDPELLIPPLWRYLVSWRDSHTVTVAKLLTAVPSFSATDPRDKVIALYGIADDLRPGLFGLITRRLSPKPMQNLRCVSYARPESYMSSQRLRPVVVEQAPMTSCRAGLRTLARAVGEMHPSDRRYSRAKYFNTHKSR